MANGYNPFQFAQTLAQLGGQVGGEGEAWEGQKKGESRETIRGYGEKHAGESAEAASGLSKAGFWSKVFGIGSMMLPGVREANLVKQFLVGALTSGITQKVLADRAVSGLSKEDMPDVLYNVPQAREVESLAHSAVDKLISEVNPSVFQTALTTPLSVLTYRNLLPGSALKGDEHIIRNMTKEGARRMGDIGSAYSSIVDRFSPNRTYDNPLFSGELGRLIDFFLKPKKY